MPAPKGNQFALGNKGGRPRFVKPENLVAFGDYMIDWAHKKVEEMLAEENVVKKMPIFLTSFCMEHGVSRYTINEYREENEEFSHKLKAFNDYIRHNLALGGLKGWWNPSAFTFIAKNETDMKDKTETDITSKGEKVGAILGMQIISEMPGLKIVSEHD